MRKLLTTSRFCGLGFLIGVIVAIAVATAVTARPPYREAFYSQYGIDKPQEQLSEPQKWLQYEANQAHCSVCHVDGQHKSIRNGYGTLFETALEDSNFDVPAALKATESETAPSGYQIGDLIRAGYLPTHEF